MCEDSCIDGQINQCNVKKLNGLKIMLFMYNNGLKLDTLKQLPDLQ